MAHVFSGVTTTSFYPAIAEFKGSKESWGEINKWIRSQDLKRGLQSYKKEDFDGKVKESDTKYASDESIFYLYV
eukprot:CAMPEP_0170481244 /NCGR_PEP_ID=MMETSP0208-20121228/1763_1 /TAXON_ID=197538 /ORGANISM="Strombidium inclinatum, Strain S3" /LENGTH=73 /DNA_ID=CAMNT_0010753911 /DNA_START=268 /DNA_END=489 /DNA_ORIENTATION=+